MRKKMAKPKKEMMAGGMHMMDGMPMKDSDMPMMAGKKSAKKGKGKKKGH